MKKILATAAGILAATTMAASASAATFVFKGDGNNVTPLGTLGSDYVACASAGDFCSDAGNPANIGGINPLAGHAGGLNYNLAGIDLNVVAYANGQATRLIQDRNPTDSGLGAWSETSGSDDQTQFDSGESIEFNFGYDALYNVTNVEFNAGGDRDCTAVTPGDIGEGYCGTFRLQVYDMLNTEILNQIVDINNIDVLAQLGVAGSRFLLTALDQGAGFTIAQLTVNEVPIPAALPLLLSGVAGLGFATRRKKKAA